MLTYQFSYPKNLSYFENGYTDSLLGCQSLTLIDIDIVSVVVVSAASATTVFVVEEKHNILQTCAFHDKMFLLNAELKVQYIIILDDELIVNIIFLM